MGIPAGGTADRAPRLERFQATAHRFLADPADPGSEAALDAALAALSWDDATLDAVDRVVTGATADGTPGRRGLLSGKVACALADAGRGEAALPRLDLAAALAPGRGFDRRAGVILGEAGRPELAAARFARELSHAPDDVESLVGRGWALDALGQDQEALDLFERAVLLAPSAVDPAAITALGAGRGTPPSAGAEALRAAVAASPADPRLRLALAAFLLGTEDDEGAQREMAEAGRLLGRMTA